MQTFPAQSDIGKAVKKLKISTELLALPDTNMITHSIQLAIKKNKLNDALKFIQDQYQDNPNLVNEVIGEELVKEIINL